jgi:hypothetical protein
MQSSRLGIGGFGGLQPPRIDFAAGHHLIGLDYQAATGPFRKKSAQ